MSNSQSRKWQLTINNPEKYGLTHDVIREKLGEFKSMVYWCMADEVGSEDETYHTHIYMALSSATRFSTIKKKFPPAHMEMAKGTSQQNKDYVFKQGKWEKDKKVETHLAETREEYGEMPIERQGARNDLADLYDMIKQGMSNFEILEICPEYMFNVDKIERVRQTIKEEEFRHTFRQLEVTYVFGKTGAGKTRHIMEHYGYSNVFRVTDYLHPFDSYKGQDVVVFEEFRSDLKMNDMLNYLDGYPLELPCRYSNKIACFTKVFIVTNLSLKDQYLNIQESHPETWKAFLRRIDVVRQYTGKNVVNKKVVELEEFADFTPVSNDQGNPFKIV